MLKAVPVTETQKYLMIALKNTTEEKYPLVCVDYGCRFSHVHNGVVYVIPVCIYLDDNRTPPRYWFIVRDPDECIELIRDYSHVIEAISFDNDLGVEKEGHDVVDWLESAVHDGMFRDQKLPRLFVHSSNEGAKPKILAAFDSIKRIHERQNNAG